MDPVTQCLQGPSTLAYTLPLFILCWPYSPSKASAPQRGNGTPSQRALASCSHEGTITSHPNRQYQGATLISPALVKRPLGTHVWHPAGKSCGRFCGPTAEPPCVRVCVPASMCACISAVGRRTRLLLVHLLSPHLSTPQALRAVCVLVPGICPNLSPKHWSLKAVLRPWAACGCSRPGPVQPAVPTVLLRVGARHSLCSCPVSAPICPPQPLASDQAEAPPCNLTGLPWHSPRTWLSPLHPWPLHHQSHFLLVRGNGPQFAAFSFPSHSRPTPQGAVAMCRWCRGPCRT